MVTKWKNIIKGISEFIKANRRLVFGGIFLALGIAVFVLLYNSVFSYGLNTRITWIIGSMGNALLSVGTWLLVDTLLRRHYGNWFPQDETFYGEWKDNWLKQQKTIALIAGIGLVIAYLFYFSKREYYYIFTNYAFMYLLMATVLLQCGISEVCILRFMKGRLNLLMDKMTDINEESLAAAIEIEKESIKKAAKSEQLKVDLISNVSHDLKTPLTSMVGYIELMKKEDLDDTMQDYVEVLSDKAEKLKVMIESLFSLAKASSGNIKMNIESINLNRLIEQIFADMEDQISTSRLHFVKILTDENTQLRSDNLHLYRICQNLIENAIKYSARETRVFVKTYIDRGGEEERVCLEITNTAGYLMDFDKEDIVERFSRGDKARSSEGNGLGLAIVSTYTSALGGAFDINIDCDQFKATLSFAKEQPGADLGSQKADTAELLGIKEYLEP